MSFTGIDSYPVIARRAAKKQSIFRGACHDGLLRSARNDDFVLIGKTFAALGLASLVGGMLFFGAIMAPLVFTKLPPDVAGPFIRQVFPRYYWFVIVSAAVAAGGFAWQRQVFPALAMLAIVAVTCWLLWWLIPHLNMMREAGNDAAFARGHRLSVWVNGAELLTALAVLMISAAKVIAR